jgi:hypothetical protein
LMGKIKNIRLTWEITLKTSADHNNVTVMI